MLPNAGALVYGTITVGALLAAESAERENYPDTVAAVAIALVVFWLAHAYSEFTAQQLQRKQPFTVRGLARELSHELRAIAGATIPLVVLMVLWAAGAHLQDAVTAALWISAAMIVIVEAVAGVRAELSGRALIAQTAIGGFFGLLVIAVKLVLH